MPESIFFLEYHFTHYRDTKNAKPCCPYRHLNYPLNRVIDSRGGNMIPRQSVISIILSEIDLNYIRCVTNPTICSFSCSKSNPLVFSRLDCSHISDSLSDNVYNVNKQSEPAKHIRKHPNHKFTWEVLTTAPVHG